MNKNRPFKCDICECTFVQRGKLINHVDAVHEKKKPFKCEFCDYRSSRKENIKSHVESVHEKKKPFKCASCVYLQMFYKDTFETSCFISSREKEIMNVKFAIIFLL